MLTKKLLVVALALALISGLAFATTRSPQSGVTRYVALLNQTGTNAPSATVLENTGSAITWSRHSAGIYKAETSGGFPAGRTVVFVGSAQSGEITDAGQTTAWRDGSVIFVYTQNIDLGGQSASGTDGMLTDTPIEIRVYPE